MATSSVDEIQPEEPANQPFVVVIKVGGNELDDESFLFGLAQAVKTIQADGHWPVIVHGGGKAIASYQERLGLQPRFVEGLRVTDEPSMAVAEMVLSGLSNKLIVRTLVHQGIRAAGISGVDDATIYVEKMWHPLGDLGRVGEIQDVDPHLINILLEAGVVPVISPISFGALDGLSYNVNADHAATAVAAKLGAIKLIFVSNVPGVLVAGRVIRAMTSHQAEQWIEEGIITGGMIPKVRSAIHAVQSGVVQAVITNIAGVQDGGGTGIIGTR
jgi:acetylglutamate kinase